MSNTDKFAIQVKLFTLGFGWTSNWDNTQHLLLSCTNNFLGRRNSYVDYW